MQDQTLDLRRHGAAEPASDPCFHLSRAAPAAALGLAVAHLMTKPAFARLPFGLWSRVLVGQVNRGHYHLVLDGADRVVGFLGWVLTDEAGADAWLRGEDLPDAAARGGDCIVVNAWSADTPAVNRFVLDLLRAAMHGRRLMYFKRHYPRGGARKVRMPVNAFVGRKLGG